MPRVSVLGVVCMWSDLLASSGVASAQSLGTFRWQLLPFCSVVSLAVTSVAGGFRVEGTDDQPMESVS